MRRFYLYKRNSVYYARLINPESKKIMSAKSTGQKDKDEAAYIAMGWLKNGIPQGHTKNTRKPEEYYSIDDLLFKLKNTTLIDEDVKRILSVLKSRGFIENAQMKKENQETIVDFLISFWDYDNSPYIQNKLSHGQKITKNHVNNKSKLVGKYWKAFFNDSLLLDFDRQKLNDFSIWLSKKYKTDHKGNELSEKLSPQTMNNILKTGTVAFKWAYINKIIGDNPAEGITLFSGKSKKRGIFSDKEVQKLFEKGNWTGSPANELGNITAMQTGLRMGEIIGLQVKDILPDRLKVIHSYSEHDGLKATKTEEEREVAILPELSQKLLKYAKLNPNGCNPLSYVFWHISEPDKPHAGKNLSLALYRTMKSIGIDKTERQSRGICFHSWRHYYADKMARALGQQAAKLTGHSTPEMLDHYANHANEKDFDEAKRATSEVFGRILNFQEAI